MASSVTSTSAQVSAARRPRHAPHTVWAWMHDLCRIDAWQTTPGTLRCRHWLPRHWRGLRNLAGLGLLALLAACSTEPMRSSGVGTVSPRPYVRTEPAPASRPEGLPEFVDHSVGEEEISIEAMSLVGIPYRWGGNTPVSGFDCSGLVKYVVQRAASVDLPRTTGQMEYAGTAIAPDQVAPGDLIFFDTDGRPYSHVGIYVGHYAFVDAPSTGGTVRIDYVTNPYWARHFNGIRRVAIGHPAPFQSAPLEAAAPAALPALPVTAMQGPSRTEDMSASTDTRADNPSRLDTRSLASIDDSHQDDGGATLTVPLYSGPRTLAAPIGSPAASPTATTRSDASADDNTQPDPIAQFANLSGTGSVPATVRTAEPTATPAAPFTALSTAPSTTASADPIAAFAGSKF